MCWQEQRLISQMQQLDLGACFGQERLDEPMTQEQFLAQTPARCVRECVRVDESGQHSAGEVHALRVQAGNKTRVRAVVAYPAACAARTGADEGLPLED